MVTKIEEFGQFAESTLTQHLIELRNECKKEGIRDKRKTDQAYHSHQQILEEELDKRILQLADEKNLWLKQSLSAIKKKYLGNFVQPD